MNNTTNNKKIIWTSINPGLLCAKEMVKQETPNISKEELNAIVLAFNFRYFEKVKKMLDKASIGKPIIVITKYEGINESVGDYTRVTVIDSGNLGGCLDTDYDLAEWYIDENGDFCSYGVDRLGVRTEQYFALNEEAPLSMIQHLFADFDDEDFDYEVLDEILDSIGDDVLSALRNNRCFDCRGAYNGESSQTGLIGYLRADMGTLGTEFFSTWNGFRDDLNTQDFKDDIDTVINSFREKGGFLSNRDQLEDFCINSDKVFAYNTGVDYGVRVNTKDYAFLMRLNPYKGNYNLYCYCYKKDWLDHHLEKAERGIRFIDSHYNEKFRLYDGDQIVIGKPDGSFDTHNGLRDRSERYDVRYIDDYHFEYGRNLRHICEFAELLEKSGNVVVPLRASLPDQCYTFVEGLNMIAIINKGELGYTDAKSANGRPSENRAMVNKMNEQLGVTKAQYAAMKQGSRFGFDKPDADPKNYTEKGTLIKPKNRNHDAR